VRERVVTAVQRLTTHGHRLRRPHVGHLGEGLYELRVPVDRIQHRVLFFFHGTQLVILAQGLTKEREVPREEIRRALHRLRVFESDPGNHSAEVDLD